MCLYALHHWPKIAWKPIKVYKILERSDHGIVTPFQGVIVESEQLMRADRFSLYATGSIEHGIHAYTNYAYAMHNEFLCGIVAEAIIPRFSLYYLGANQEICSNRLQLPKF